MNLDFTRRWFDAGKSSGDISSEVLTDCSPPENESLYLAIQLANLITHCQWKALDILEGEARERPSAFSAMALAIIKNVRMAALKVMQGESLAPAEVATIHDRMSVLLSVEANTPAFASAIEGLAEQLQPVLLNSEMQMPLGNGRLSSGSSLHTMCSVVGSGIRALAPKSLKDSIEGIQENDERAYEPLKNRNPTAIAFGVLSEVTYEIYGFTGEKAAYDSRHALTNEPLPDYEKWPDRVRQSPLPETVQS